MTTQSNPTTEITAPNFPESVADGTVATWHKQPGEVVNRDDLLVDIETDKVVLEVFAPADGALREIIKSEGDVVESNEIIALFEAGAASTAEKSTQAKSSPTTGADEQPAQGSASANQGEPILSPAARKLASEHQVDVQSLQGSGKGGRITKEDVQSAVNLAKEQRDATPVSTQATPVTKPSSPRESISATSGDDDDRVERRVPMTRLRASIAKRLVEAQHTAAMLTTFNEVNMAPIMALRKQYGEEFERRHEGVRLGFMSFFVKASVEALKRFPDVNASIDGDDIVYHGYQDIGVAVSSNRGLVVPILRNAEQMGLADIESTIKSLSEKAQTGKLTIEEMTGGTFTISNGGIFGSMLSTPIINPPQTAILGMHKIQDRVMAVDGVPTVLPMMYLALSYDHRMIDGREAVQFLTTIKALLEEPARIMLEI